MIVAVKQRDTFDEIAQKAAETAQAAAEAAQTEADLTQKEAEEAACSIPCIFFGDNFLSIKFIFHFAIFHRNIQWECKDWNIIAKNEARDAYYIAADEAVNARIRCVLAEEGVTEDMAVSL